MMKKNKQGRHVTLKELTANHKFKELMVTYQFKPSEVIMMYMEMFSNPDVYAMFCLKKVQGVYPHSVDYLMDYCIEHLTDEFVNESLVNIRNAYRTKSA
jgi:hypothetical protein